MSKYIDADCLRTEIKNLIEKYSSIKAKGAIQEGYKSGRLIGYEDTLHKLDSLQQEQSDGVLIPKWCLENIENTLRIQYNINNTEYDDETCQDRNIKESLNCVRKLLNGEEITGLERSEPLMKQSEVDLDEEIEKELRLHYNDDQDVYWWNYLKNSFHHFYKLGRKQVLQEIYDGKTKPVDKITAAWLDD